MGGGQFSKASEPTRPQYNLTMVDSIAESARKASAGTWRKPRVRIYDYNQDIGSNYYQPMIKYINQKEIYGPYMEKKAVEMPERAEIGSNKYSNMRYDDKSNANLDLDDFLVKAYAKQIKELNSSTGRPNITYYLTKAYYKLTKNKAYSLYYYNSPFFQKRILHMEFSTM